METEVLKIKAVLRELIGALAVRTSDTPRGLDMHVELLELLQRLDGK